MAPAVPKMATPEEGATYFGLGDGLTSTWARDDQVSEVHAMTTGVGVRDGVALDVVARENGLVVDARTRTLEVTDEALLLTRALDCLRDCESFEPPVVLARWPLSLGAVAESSVVVTRTGSSPGTVDEVHRTTVGDPIDVEVPAGLFTGQPIVWTRTRDDVTTSARLVVVPNVGIVVIEDFDAHQLALVRTQTRGAVGSP
jgi:hypothetical protein